MINNSHIRILGIDPGSRKTGFGVIEISGRSLHYITSGIIRTSSEEIPERLKVIAQGIAQIIEQYTPNEVAVEQVFMARNADSALKLGQARGAAIVAATLADLPVFEYSAKQIKRALVGTGSAAKNQVQHMVKALLELSGDIKEDAADALGVAICHHNMQSTLGQLDQITRLKHGRWQ